jgi:F-type H+-transporting ATPase subunit b
MDNPLVQPDPGLYIWTIATFLVLVALLAKFAWRPLLEALEGREKAIAKSLEEARQAKAELERLHAESARILAEARAKADEILTSTRADATRFRDEMKEQARAEAATIVQGAERQIQYETARAVQQIRQETIELSVAIASKLLKRNVSVADTDRLIDETVKEIEGVNRPH